MKQHGGGVRRPIEKGLLRATCWCEATYVGIPRQWIGTQTKSCGKADCNSHSKRAAKSTPQGET